MLHKRSYNFEAAFGCTSQCVSKECGRKTKNKTPPSFALALTLKLYFILDGSYVA